MVALILPLLDTPVLALTGTADQGTSAAIISGLGLKKNRVELFVSPNRENLRISVVACKKEEAFNKLLWISDMIRNHGLDCPKTLVFCNTMKNLAEVANYLLFKLGQGAYFPPNSSKMADCIIGIYHSMTWQEYKERVIKSMKGEGKKRVIIATSALSMGVNFPDVRYVVHWGPARNLLDHHQQSERAGWDGLTSDVIVIYHGHQLIHCEEDIKKFVRSGGCLRVSSYKPLDSNVQPLEPSHNCCINCRKSCMCGDNGCGEPPLPFTMETEADRETEVPSRQRMLTSTDKDDLKDALIELKCEIEGRGALFECTGFSSELIDDIVNRSQYIFTIQDLTRTSPVFSLRHAIDVLEIFSEMFQDICGLDNLVALLNEELFEDCVVPCFSGIFDSSHSDSSADELDRLDI